VQSGLPVKAVVAMLPIGAFGVLLAKPGITSISQLKGQTVAYTTAPPSRPRRFARLPPAGLTQKDVTQVNVAPISSERCIADRSRGRLGGQRRAEGEYEQANPGAVILSDQETVKPGATTTMLATTAALGNQGEGGGDRRFHRATDPRPRTGKTHESTYRERLLREPLHLTTTEAQTSS